MERVAITRLLEMTSEQDVQIDFKKIKNWIEENRKALTYLFIAVDIIAFLFAVYFLFVEQYIVAIALFLFSIPSADTLIRFSKKRNILL